jgi:ABC-type transporter Mla subunit MlaD
MALFGKEKKRGRRTSGTTPFKAGLLLIGLTVIFSYFAFTKSNPFSRPFEFSAVFESASNIAPRSPVRIAGVEVGRVKEVKALPGRTGHAMITMEMQEIGLPIHKDAELKVRQRIFLEGAFFIDVRPGSPSAPLIEREDTIPIQQTSYPVQFGQVLTALQTDTREDLRTFLAEYALKGLKGSGARGFNRSIPYWEPAYKNTALVNDAFLGTQDGDLQRLMRGQQRTFGALSSDTRALKDLITDFNTTAAAFAREDDALQALFPALRDVLVKGPPALRAVNSALPSLRAFARDALEGTKSVPETVDASIPFLRQLRGLFQEDELRGLVRDLRPTVPALARLNRSQIPFLREQRAFSSCQNKVMLPWAYSKVPDPDFPENTDQEVYKQTTRGFVALAGESRQSDANTPWFRLAATGGPFNLRNTGSGGDEVFSQAPFPIAGVRPAKPLGGPPERGTTTPRPVNRPNVPCETQEPPNLEAPSGQSENANGGTNLQPTLEQLSDPAFINNVTESFAQVLQGATPGGATAPLSPPAALSTARRGMIETEQLQDHLRRKRMRLPSVDPLDTAGAAEKRELERLDLERIPNGRIVDRRGMVVDGRGRLVKASAQERKLATTGRLPIKAPEENAR